MAKKWVYKFEEGRASDRNLLGGKGCNLAEMTYLGMRFVVSVPVTRDFVLYASYGRYLYLVS